MFTSRVLTRSIAAAAAAAVIATGAATTANAAPQRLAVDLPIVCSDEGFNLLGGDLPILQGVLGGLTDGVSGLLLTLTNLLSGVTRTVCEGLPDVPLPDGLDLGDLGLGSITDLGGLFDPGVKLLTSPVAVTATSPLVGLVLVAGATDPATGTVDVLLNDQVILKDLPLVNILGLGLGVNLELPAGLLADGGALTVRYNGTIPGGNTTSIPKTLDVTAGLLGATFTGTSATAATFPANPRITGTIVGPLIDTNLLQNLSLLNGNIGILDSLVTPVAPTGTVKATVAGRTVGTGVVEQNGGFSINTTGLAVGSNAVVLTYQGDTLHSTSTKSVTAAKSKATAVLNTSTVNSTYGASARIGVRVATPTGGATPTGTADLTLAGKVVQTKTLASGVANFALPAKQAPGSYGYAVSYRGNGNYTAGSKNVTVSVAKARSGLTSTIAPVAFGSLPVVAVRLSGIDALSGTVWIFSGATQVGSGSIGSSKANITLAKQFPVGRRTLVVKYYGSTTHLASQATTILTVGKAIPTIRVVPDTRTTKGKVYLRTSLSGVAPVGLYSAVTAADAKPTGSIVLTLGTRTVKSVSAASATSPRSFPFDLGTLPKGTFTYRLRYAGDDTYRPASVEVRVVIK